MAEPSRPPAAAPESGPVRRRQVLYVSGFDPQGPNHYHQLYQAEGRSQAALEGWTLEVGPRRKRGPQAMGWTVRWQAGPDAPATDTQFDLLRWDDVVRAHWPRGRWGLMGRIAYASWALWRGGVLWKLARSSWPQFMFMAFPGLALLLLALGSAGVLAGAAHLAWQGALGWGLALAALGLPALAGAAEWAERRSFSGWMMRSTACMVDHMRGRMPDLDERLDRLAGVLLDHWQAQADPHRAVDELLVVGHSSGAMMAVIVVARALARWPAGQPRPPLSFLTLGHCTPIMSYQPEAAAFRADLDRLAALGPADGLHWVDLSSPVDGCCMPLQGPPRHPWARPPHTSPRVLNARFAQRFSPAAYARIKADKYRCHFQYLMAADLPGGPDSLDYFRLTAGPQTLAQRCGHRPAVTDFRQFQHFGPVPW
ncbi:hypothetical protein [Ideonella livida]|uniref:Fungal lipase-like domain-containing protein n=1 Tax=Ideonella livida TaxID=2707176 RepID=A0A7C9TLR1_9BURK|nr:hypothetical protein [Ideonella livida]NDY92664.1 hypothetical protein [Ideonella livida]